MKILEVSDLNKSYKEKQVLKNISFSINEGEIVALIGPNGAGKTTIMKIISNLLKQDSGIVKIEGISAKDNLIEYLSKFSSVIETPSLYEMLSGYDNINFIRKINNISEEKMNNILSFINIGNSINDKVKNYSLGMKQRLALGIQLMTEPKLLILDEPINGLDPQGVIEFREMIKKLASENKMSILISSHILSELEKVCSKILFIKDGELINDNYDKIQSYQTIILTVDNAKKVFHQVEKIEIVNEVKIINNRIIIKIKAEDTSSLMNSLVNNKINYNNIEIVNNNNIEKAYNEIYLGGKYD
ncbi:ABC transporter ATP-binding protein [Clostridium sp. D43t1_170807_H7]|uniref:ABC transporter ATP-binding protein n=1 Tax=Clostridium sp. D43t1_170807_H7 TaxID=2787140 RepID=UPI00189B89B7|nr:ABC transporter ATP-binding protein [Clostridium sp. D43t1_170807_H7]